MHVKLVRCGQSCCLSMASCSAKACAYHVDNCGTQGCGLHLLIQRTALAGCPMTAVAALCSCITTQSHVLIFASPFHMTSLNICLDSFVHDVSTW